MQLGRHFFRSLIVGALSGASCAPPSTGTAPAAVSGTGPNAGSPAVPRATAGAGAELDVSFATSVQPFIDKACNCHQSTPVLMAPFSLKPADAYVALVNTPSLELPSMVRVEPGSTADSYLWHKLDGTQLQVGGSGQIMPSNIPLNDDERAIFERWINAGAPP